MSVKIRRVADTNWLRAALQREIDGAALDGSTAVVARELWMALQQSDRDHLQTYAVRSGAALRVG